ERDRGYEYFFEVHYPLTSSQGYDCVSHRYDCVIDETRRYIHDFEAVAERTATTIDLYRGMLELHPDRVNQGALWGSARSAKG
ncbi:hypothetical protein ACFC0P_50455, partial [Streptomyces broussonetiae]